MKTIVVLSGAGMSAESGLKTFRDNGGLWENQRVDDVATPEAWLRDRALVLRFYNERRRALLERKMESGRLAQAPRVGIPQAWKLWEGLKKNPCNCGYLLFMAGNESGDQFGPGQLHHGEERSRSRRIGCISLFLQSVSPHPQAMHHRDCGHRSVDHP
jgi:hypothetical protein